MRQKPSIGGDDLDLLEFSACAWNCADAGGRPETVLGSWGWGRANFPASEVRPGGRETPVRGMSLRVSDG
jgi:hypothetical protein